jgi:xanthine dehydrogenase accessory factor
MKEIRDILKSYEQAQLAGKKTALATVVHIQGSSYRQPGARMLVTIDGQLTGAISGGCLEGDALRKALLVMAQQKPMLVTYDTNDEDDAKLGVGLGCNGIIQILIEPVETANPLNPLALLQKLSARRQKAVLTTVFDLENKKGIQPGTCLLLSGSETSLASQAPAYLHDLLLKEARQVLETNESSTKTFKAEKENFTAFTEFIAPAVSLVIFGAGNDTMPIVKMADVLGWPVTLVDGRANYATQQRFPLATKVLIAKPAAVLNAVECDERTVFLLMTHNYNYDLAMLRQLIELNTPYIGMLGPKKKFQKMLDELKEEGITLTVEQAEKIYAPVGFDIGAESSEEISLSILAEIKSVLMHKKGNSLRSAAGTIHEHSRQTIAEVNMIAGDHNQ